MEGTQKFVHSLSLEKKERQPAGDDLPDLIAPIELQENSLTTLMNEVNNQ